ncbi:MULTISPECIES: hypothetical protein [Bradyrhizobium]|jgi:hypothetical protein|uniref:hypothetical protein n=1 Tax=Bradyrhizobium TaxID=374 RepID=UPI000418750E|nr:MULTISPECIES: hypothetical protein [Bradyrhizobium]KIU43124.1 hypothetical protein QU41_33880 [Bradyrhizobium elkanii]MBK5653589.1 hypothetical protein [Rhizobium sp.]OCX30054.1 hypothetical protein QU42_17015 [Bradyrhizobium sp. UASWS1016]
MRLAALAIILASAVGIVAYDQYDKSTNYTRVDARVSGVNDQCYLEKIERGILTKTRWTSDMVGCEAAELMRKDNPKWQGYNVGHKIELRVVYVSPVDGISHQSVLRMASFPCGQPLHAGDLLPVLASRTKVDRTRLT